MTISAEEHKGKTFVQEKTGEEGSKILIRRKKRKTEKKGSQKEPGESELLVLSY